MAIYDKVPQGQLGNRYKAANITVIDGTTDYSICENNPSIFPDWNADWNERDYYDILVIKNLGYEISVKFHGPQYDTIQIVPGDCPAIWEHFVYRDIYITNLSGNDANFNVIFINNRTISPPPLKPINVELEVLSSTSIKISFEDITKGSNSFNEDYFKIERSSTSALTGFAQIGIGRTPALAISQGKPRIITFTDTTCAPATQYWYRVRAYSLVGGNSNYTDGITGTTL